MTGTQIVLSILLLTVIARPIAAQDQPSVDLFGGYSELPADGDDFPRQTSHGFQGAVTAHLNRWFGIVGDIGAQFNTTTDLGPNFQGRVARTTVWQYLVGPRFTARSEGVDLFGHGLFGVSTGVAGPWGAVDRVHTRVDLRRVPEPAGARGRVLGGAERDRRGPRRERRTGLTS